MDAMSWIEWYGLAASVVIAYSLMLKDIVKLRCWNMLGAAMFSSYGMLIGAMPVTLLNGFIVLVNAYYLIQLRKASRVEPAVVAEPS